MKKVIIFLLFAIVWVFAQKQSLVIDSNESYISYSGSHILHKWSGQSYDIQGEITVDKTNPQNSEIALIIPIYSFDSQNGNRDSNMLFVTEEDIYPNVKFSSTSISRVEENMGV